MRFFLLLLLLSLRFNRSSIPIHTTKAKSSCNKLMKLTFRSCLFEIEKLCTEKYQFSKEQRLCVSSTEKSVRNFFREMKCFFFNFIDTRTHFDFEDRINLNRLNNLFIVNKTRVIQTKKKEYFFTVFSLLVSCNEMQTRNTLQIGD